MNEHEYGWKPELPDQRDKLYGSIFSPHKSLPEKVDLREFCSPVENQGNTSSCTAHALTSCYELMQKKSGLPQIDLSRFFLYYNERAMEGTVNQDSGAYIRDGIKSLVKKGCCEELLWSFNPNNLFCKPPAECYLDALEHQVKQYQRLNSLTEMLSCLADGFPFVFGFSVYESFETDEVAKTGIMPVPGKDEKLLGGHCILAVGYDSHERMLTIQNSWGSNFGQKGFFMMPFEIAANRNMSDDFWSLRNIE